MKTIKIKTLRLLNGLSRKPQIFCSSSQNIAQNPVVHTPRAESSELGRDPESLPYISFESQNSVIFPFV